MIKILFAPSETKKEGGVFPPITESPFMLYQDKKMHIANMYQTFLAKASMPELEKLFGIKKEEDIIKYKDIDIYHDKTLPAIERYTGVAYDYIDYPSLSSNEKSYINDTLIIFSNIFGALKASEHIPNYKLKQNEKLDGFAIEKFYKQECSKEFDNYLDDALVIDLRAGFYNKFYTPKKPYITMKFIKNGKVVSHWAKAYRGKVVRELAKKQPQNEKELSEINFENLNIKEIVQMGNKKEYIYEITEA